MNSLRIAVCLAVGALSVVGCSSDDESASDTTAPAKSYCDLVTEYTAVDGEGKPSDEVTTPQFTEQTELLRQAVEVAPAEVKSDVEALLAVNERVLELLPDNYDSLTAEEKSQVDATLISQVDEGLVLAASLAVDSFGKHAVSACGIPDSEFLRSETFSEVGDAI
jgi:hypothetical protein